jgi:hypothetical protein
VTAHFSQVTGNFAERKLTTDSQGNAVMPHCANLAVDLTGSAPGFETVRQSFASLTTNETLKLATRRGTATRGLVLDKTSGQPLAGAVIQMLFQQGASESYYDWESHPVVLATSDRDGHFVTTQLRQDSRYRLGVSLPGRESVVLKGVRAGDSNLVARLGPELIVHGRITGNLQAVTNQDGTANVDYTINDQETHIGRSYFVNARTTNGVIYFEFTNRTAWPVDLHVAGFRETRTVADWLVELTNPPANPMPPSMRDVVVRLKAVSGIPPRGAIKFVVPANPNHQQIEYDNKRVALTNGAARLALPVGAGFSYELDKTTLGYWFESGFTWTNVAAGDGPLVIEVPVIPAGVIAARARNADGSPAGGLTFSILVVKPPPAVNNRNATGYDQGDGFSDNGPRHYVTPPLPLGGEYEIIGWRGNSFCVSDPIKLTEAAPDPEVELQFPPGQDLTGRILGPDGQPVRDAKVDNEAEINDHSFGLKPTFTDANGTFRLTECSQDIAHYTLKVSQSGFASEKVTADFQHLPLTVRLQPGLKLTGRVVEAASGGVIPNAEVRVVPEEAGHWTPVTTRTDANGQYEFNTLGAATYQVFVNGANIGPKNHGQFHMTEFHAGVVTNLELKVSPYPGSQLAVRRAR